MNQQSPLKALAFLAVPTALLLMSAPVWAEPFQGEGERPPQHGAHSMGKGHPQQVGGPRQQGQRPARRSQMMEQLGLSAEQKQKVKALMEQGKGQSKSLNEQLKTKRQAMMQYLQSPNASEAKAKSMNNEINDIQRQLSELRLKTWFDMRSILTPEQLQKLNQMKGKLPGGMGGGSGSFGEGGHRPPGGMMQQHGQMGPRRGSMQHGQFGPGGGEEGFGPGPDSGFVPQSPGFGPASGTRIGYAPNIPEFPQSGTSPNQTHPAPMPEPSGDNPLEIDDGMVPNF